MKNLFFPLLFASLSLCAMERQLPELSDFLKPAQPGKIDFEKFVTDVQNFLDEILETTPSQTRVKKILKICHFGKECVQKNEPLKPFINFVRNNYLDKLKPEEITSEKIKNLYELYKKQ